jgi:hypothetical protein
MKPMNIYFDSCCLNRLFDDQTQPRIRLESEAVLLILSRIQTEETWRWIGSDILKFEIGQTPNVERRARTQALLLHIDKIVKSTEIEATRAKQFQALGIKSFDALHIACAETAEADVFLTTDDKLLRRVNNYQQLIIVKAVNPVSWTLEWK